MKMDEPKDDCQPFAQPDGTITTPPKKKGWPKGKPRPKRNLPGPTEAPKTTEKPVRLNSKGEPRKRGDAPACENFPNDMPLQFVVWTEDKTRNGVRVGTGIFFDPERIKELDKVGREMLFMNVQELPSGKLAWSYRKMDKSPVPYRYEMVFLSKSSMIAMAKGLVEKCNEWFGGQRKVDEEFIEWQAEKKADLLGDKIRREGIF
jgi:hypothetical protein